MLNTEKAYPTVGVKDMAVARKFYEGPLGLQKVADEGPDFVAYEANGSRLFVYKSEFAGTNEATAVTWIVADVEKAVENLKARGVAFEHYDMPGMTLEGDVHVAEEMKVAWFKDPDGNIHSIAEE
ncbi:MAG TPA: VOC family protein [Gemmatimonadota bacterium]|nr:VOC family protein [Gemmatimonadota bacterium]